MTGPSLRPDLPVTPSPSEERSWSNSLRALSSAIQLGGFTDHGILLEYQLPLSSRQHFSGSGRSGGC